MRASNKLFLDYAHLALLMRKLGEFHAYSYAAKTSEPHRFRCLANSLSDNNSKFVLGFLGELDGNWLRPALAMLREDPRYAPKLGDLEEFTGRVKSALLESLRNDRHDDTLVLCHGNFCGPNFLFKYENGKPVDGKIVDLTNCMLSSPALDLTWVLYSSADPQMRRERGPDLMNEYYGALRGTFPEVDVPKMEYINGGIRKKLIFAGIHATVYIAFVSAIERGYADTMTVSFRDMIRIGNTMGPEIRMEILKDVIDHGGI